jgi:hypothetical protein
MQTKTQRELYYSAEHWSKQAESALESNDTSRAMYCFKEMFANDLTGNLTINGINFDRMLDDEKKRLHKKIDQDAACMVICQTISEAFYYVGIAKQMELKRQKPMPAYKAGGLAIVGEMGRELNYAVLDEATEYIIGPSKFGGKLTVKDLTKAQKRTFDVLNMYRKLKF